MKSITLRANSISMLKSELTSQNTVENPSLAIVFHSIVFEIKDIQNAIAPYNVEIFGASSAGEIIDSQVSEQGIVVMLLDIKRAHFNVVLESYSPDQIFVKAQQIAKLGKGFFANPAFIFVSAGIMNDPDLIILGVDSQIANAKIFGGSAADDLRMENSYVYNSDSQTNDGLLALIIDTDKIEIDGLAADGWESVGLEHTITKATNNVVYEINNQPVLDIFVKYFDLDLEAGKFTNAINFAQYPFQMQKQDGSYVLRAPLVALHDQQAIVFASALPVGEIVKFSLPSGFEITELVVNDFKKFKAKTYDYQAIILFSCIARKMALGPLIEDEIQQIYQLWDNVSMVGMFGYGEIGKKLDSSKSEFHNETCSLIALKEK